MYLLFEEGGHFKLGKPIKENEASFLVEALSGKHLKLKKNQVLLRFQSESPHGVLQKAEEISETFEIALLWNLSPETEFSFNDFAQSYFGDQVSSVEYIATLIALQKNPIYFYRKSKGKFLRAPEENIEAALKGIARKEEKTRQVATWVASLQQGQLPAEFDSIPALLYNTDAQSGQLDALKQACQLQKCGLAQLLQRCGVFNSHYDYHLHHFKHTTFQGGCYPPHPLDIPKDAILPPAESLPIAFSIDDSTTTEIDDAFSVQALSAEVIRIGVHIAAPALYLHQHPEHLQYFQKNISTVYLPGGVKFTMLPEPLIQAYSLDQGRVVPAMSCYFDVRSEDQQILCTETKLDHIYMAHNLRLEQVNAYLTLADIEAHSYTSNAPENPERPHFQSLCQLYQFAQKRLSEREQASGKKQGSQRVEYNFCIQDLNSPDTKIDITPRQRSAPVDTLVAELMILVNTHWGEFLATRQMPAIYRSQQNDKVKMGLEALPHQNMGVPQYAWSSSPLRRCIDLVNQAQLISLMRKQPPLYNSEGLNALVLQYEHIAPNYDQFQRKMERYWCLRYIECRQITQLDMILTRNGWASVENLPLTLKPSLVPAHLTSGVSIQAKVSSLDLWENHLSCQFISISPSCH